MRVVTESKKSVAGLIMVRRAGTNCSLLLHWKWGRS